MRVLIADDDAVLRSMLAAQVKAEGFEVQTHASGSEAFAALVEEDAPPLAMLDWMMPGMEGPEICAGIRTRQRIRQPYLIVMSVKTQASDIAQAFASGADEYIVKPFTGRELRSKLKAARQIMDLRDRVQELERIGSGAGSAESILLRFKRCPVCGLIHGRMEGLSAAEKAVLERITTVSAPCSSCLAR